MKNDIDQFGRVQEDDSRLPEKRITIPAYLLPEDLRELHEKIRIKRRELSKMEREFRNGIMTYFSR